MLKSIEIKYQQWVFFFFSILYLVLVVVNTLLHTDYGQTKLIALWVKYMCELYVCGLQETHVLFFVCAHYVHVNHLRFRIESAFIFAWVCARQHSAGAHRWQTVWKRHEPLDSSPRLDSEKSPVRAGRVGGQKGWRVNGTEGNRRKRSLLEFTKKLMLTGWSLHSIKHAHPVKTRFWRFTTLKLQSHFHRPTKSFDAP